MRIVLCIMMLIIPVTLNADQVVIRAEKYVPILQEIINSYWFDIPYKEIPMAQIEQESSWKEKATLNTSREKGMGLTQITIAYSKDGTERFNNFKNAVKMKQLKDWDWKNDPYNVRYQLSYMILKDKSNYNLVSKYMKNDKESFRSLLVCYNAGYGRWLQRRTIAKTNGLSNNIWNGGLDSSCSSVEKSTILYGRDLCSTVNEYPIKIELKSKNYLPILKPVPLINCTSCKRKII